MWFVVAVVFDIRFVVVRIGVVVALVLLQWQIGRFIIADEPEPSSLNYSSREGQDAKEGGEEVKEEEYKAKEASRRRYKRWRRKSRKEESEGDFQSPNKINDYQRRSRKRGGGNEGGDRRRSSGRRKVLKKKKK